MSQEQQLITKIKRRYLLLRGMEITLFTLGIASIIFALFYFLATATWIPLTFALVAGVAVLFVFTVRLNLYRFTDTRITTYLNHHYPELEASTDLLLRSDNLSTLQHLQKSTVYCKLQSIEHNIRFPNHLVLSAATLMIGVLAGYFALRHEQIPAFTDNKKTTITSTDSLTEVKPVVVSLGKTTVTITPPAYTQQSTTSSSRLPLKVIEGSTVQWSFQFSGQPADFSLIFSGKDTVHLKTSGKAFRYQRTFIDGGFYQFTWTDQSATLHQSDYYPIEIIKDEAPRIIVDNLAQFIELKLTDRLIVDLKATLSDDFGLKDSHIIATVSKGSGESVKFREETLRFTTPSSITGKLQHASRAIDLIKLGLEPGDELYFYIEAFDNKTPSANKSRTETFFIALQDTITYEVTEDPGLGVDLMPEYFRSQRQIIIDSEKILEDRKGKKISKEDFNAKSNELGYDQKVLRLRYGQFMGEEADSGIGVQNSTPHEEEDEKIEDVAKKFGHTHDTENEHNLVGDKKITPAPDHHEHSEKEGDESKNPMAAFMHNHDSEEEATFFQQSVKTKLKAALTLMWDAELYLRMYQPEQSLPYQYKILKLLKEISNDSRVYVHRSGFDAPPLKEEKRLSADLSEIKNSFNSTTSKNSITYPAIRKALTTIESLLQKEQPAITASSKAILQKAGNELAGAAIAQPGVYIKSLSLLKSLLANELPAADIRSSLVAVRTSFWKIVPPQTTSPAAKQKTLHPLDQQFLKQLEGLNYER